MTLYCDLPVTSWYRSSITNNVIDNAWKVRICIWKILPSLGLWAPWNHPWNPVCSFAFYSHFKPRELTVFFMRNEHFGRTDNQVFPRVVVIFDFDSRGSLRRAKREIIVCSRLQDTVEPRNNEGPRDWQKCSLFTISHRPYYTLFISLGATVMPRRNWKQ